MSSNTYTLDLRRDLKRQIAPLSLWLHEGETAEFEFVHSTLKSAILRPYPWDCGGGCCSGTEYEVEVFFHDGTSETSEKEESPPNQYLERVLERELSNLESIRRPKI
jgi:hypothetical protein